MNYYNLQEAAKLIGDDVSDMELLRLGAFGHFLICAGFNQLAHSPTHGGNIDALGLYVIPPRCLFEIESNGEAKIGMATSLDGKEIIFPLTIIRKEQLRVTAFHLREFKDRLVKAEPADAPAGKLEAALDVVEGAANNPMPTKNWILSIQAEATRRWKELVTMGCSPTRNNIKADLAKWCRCNGVTTDGGIFPSEDYIYRHVIRAAKWRSPTD